MTTEELLKEQALLLLTHQKQIDKVAELMNLVLDIVGELHKRIAILEATGQTLQ